MSLAVVGATTLGGDPIALRASDGRIERIGPEVEPQPGDATIDAGGMALAPGLVNGHTHMAMTLFRGYGDDMALMDWLERKIWPAEARLKPADVYWGARLACLEMIRTGTVRAWDMYWHPRETARALEDAGLRGTVAAPLIERTGPGGARSLRSDAERSLEQLAECGPGIEAALAPHAIYTVGERSLRWIAERAGAKEVPIHIHLSETRREVDDCVAQHGMRPAAYLDRLGLLGPRTLLAHGVWLDDDELALVAERGATVVTNPVANMKLGVGGAFAFEAARERGVPVGLGTDGPGSNNSLDLFSDMKFCALLQKHAAADPTVASAAEVWAVATGERAPLLGQPQALRTGTPADFLLLRADAPELAPGDLVAALVYAAGGSIVDTSVVAGRVLMRGGAVEGGDEVVARATERARRLGVA